MKKQTHKQMTYAEEQGETPFDWNEFLSKERTDEEWEAAVHLAGTWVTCAVGNQCSVIKRNAPFGDPRDPILRFLGGAFYRFIENKSQKDAIIALRTIDRRSAYLIKEHYESK